MKKTSIILFVVSMLLVSGIASGMSEKHIVAQASSGRVELEHLRWRNDDGNIRIEGVLDNNTGRTLEYTKIYISVEDGNEKYLGNGWSYLQPTTILPGRTANFTVYIWDATCQTRTMAIEIKLSNYSGFVY